jgi:predicted P-loop ATPase
VNAYDPNPLSGEPIGADDDIAGHNIHVTFFPDFAAKSYTTDNLTLRDLRERVLNASARKKDNLPWLKLAVFGNRRSDKNSLRHDANVERITGIEIDYDIEEVAFADALTALNELQIAALLYTSPSHSSDKPRWRVLAPTSEPLAPELRAKLVMRLNGYLKAKLGVETIAKSESFALSQAFYYGWVCDSPKADHRAEVTIGSFIDHLDLEQYEALGAASAVNKSSASTGTGTGSCTGSASGSGGAIDWTAVEQHSGWLKSAADLPQISFSAKGRAIIGHAGSLKDLNYDLTEAGLLTDGKNYNSWSEVTLALAGIFKHGGFTNEQIAAALLADLDCNEHIRKERNIVQKRRAVERAIARTKAEAPKWRDISAPDWRERKQNLAPLPSMHNARLAITALGIECRYDTFHNKMLFGFKDDGVCHAVEHIVGEVTDNGIIALRQLMSDTFGFDFTDKHPRDAVISLALEHCFDPVVDMLAQAEANWDGVERLDRMAVDYFNCEDTKLNRAFLRKIMIAAVARARNPGIKFDNILVLESEEGFNKSTAIRVLAGDENFSDEAIIGKDSRDVQEQLAGVWLHENAELAGMQKREVEKVKNYASKQVDRARPAYGHFNKWQPRRSVEFGTTNTSEYLQSQTGNRRFWPLRLLKAIDIEKLRRDRLQLWGEAAHYQSQGESLVLDVALWGEAGIEQEARRISDPWEDVLREMPETAEYDYYKDGFWRQKEVRIIHREGDEDKVVAAELLEHVLKISPASQTTAQTMRLSTVMRKLGWERPNNGNVTIGGKRVKGYLRRS